MAEPTRPILRFGGVPYTDELVCAAPAAEYLPMPQLVHVAEPAALIKLLQVGLHGKINSSGILVGVLAPGSWLKSTLSVDRNWKHGSFNGFSWFAGLRSSAAPA